MSRRTMFIDNFNGYTTLHIKRKDKLDVEVLMDTEYVPSLIHESIYTNEVNGELYIQTGDKGNLLSILYALQNPTHATDKGNRYTTVKGVEKINEHTLRLDVRKGQIIQSNNHRVYVDCGNGTSLLHIYKDRESYQKGKPTWTYVYDTADTPMLQRIPRLLKNKDGFMVGEPQKKERKRVLLHRYMYLAPETIEEAFTLDEELEDIAYADGDIYNLRRANLIPYDRTQITENREEKKWKEDIKKRYTSNYRSKLAESVNLNGLSSEIVDKVRELGEKGYTVVEVEEETGLKRQTIGDIVYYRTWNPLRYTKILRNEEAKALASNTNKIKMTGEDTVENVKVTKMREQGVARYCIEGTPYEVDTLPIGEYQYYMEVYHDGNYIGSVQYTYGTPFIEALMTRRKTSKNIVIQKINADKYGYAKEQNTVLNRKLSYQLVNSISNTL